MASFDIKFTRLGFENACQQAFSKPCLVNLISKDTHLVFSISWQASRCQQEFSKPCLVNLISKHTHLVFSISWQASRCQQEFSKPCLVNLISKVTQPVFSIYKTFNNGEYMQMTSCFMHLAAAGRIGATKYIFTVFLKGKC